MKPTRHPTALAAIGLVLAGLAAGLATLAGFGGRWLWMLDLASHFRLHYLVALLAVTLGLAALRRFRLAAAFLLLGAVNLAAMLPLLAAPRGERSIAGAGRGEAPLSAMLANVHTANRDHRALLDLIDRHRPDLLMLLEVDTVWVEALASIEARYPHRLLRPDRHNFGIALYSRLPFESAEIVRFGRNWVPAIIAEVRVGDRRFHLVGAHPPPPISSRFVRLRDGHLDALADVVRALPGPVLMLGDLNMTPFSASFGRLLERSGLRDGCRGYQATWPAHWPLPGIPIDHALYGPGVEMTDKIVLPEIGSDHRPLLVEFELSGPP